CGCAPRTRTEDRRPHAARRAARERRRDRSTATSCRGEEHGPRQLPLRRRRVLSYLTTRAPVRHASPVALRPRADRLTAAWTRSSGTAIHLAAAADAFEATLHLVARGIQHAQQFLVGDRREWPPRRDRGGPQAFRLPHVPDPRDESLVKERVADSSGLLDGAQPLEDRVEVGLVGEDVGTEPRR